MNILFVILLSCTLLAASKKDIEEAKKTIQSVIGPLLVRTPKEKTSGFRVDKCEKHRINLEDLLLIQKSVTMTYKFREGCDVEGTVNPKILTPFPLKMALKNAGNFQEIISHNKITANLELRPILQLNTTAGELKGKKGVVNFEVDYQVRLNPLEGKEGQKNLGGELRISQIYGEKVNIKEKILIK